MTLKTPHPLTSPTQECLVLRVSVSSFKQSLLRKKPVFSYPSHMHAALQIKIMHPA